MPSEIHLKHALPNGTRLGRYLINGTIGGGGFSIVYKAIDRDKENKVVIKEFMPMEKARRLEDQSLEYLSENSGDSSPVSGIKRFFDEAGALARFRHPSIVKVSDVFRANNTVYMVMDYHRGHDLRWYIRRHNGRLSEKFIRTVFPKLMEGLQAMHEQHMLHLDIKPANILIRPGGKPLLLDFGATKESLISNRASGPHTLTMGFAPIEQHRHAHVGPWSDIYALGATMYACIAGKAPPNAPEREKKDKLKPLRKTHGRYYSKSILETIDWCLQLDQLQRPQSIRELIEYMDRDWLDEEDDGPGLLDYLENFGIRLPKLNK
jgi:serine/threonine protein kinase